eukprot:jgi/Hompol1/4874/HPOL_003973-RA
MTVDTQTLQITVVTDVVCFPCFYGKRAQKLALELLRQKGYSVDIDYRFVPYELASGKDLDKIGVSKRERFLSTKTQQDLDSMIAQLSQIASKVGIEYAYDGVASTTVDAHRLVHFAQRYNLHSQIADELYSAYHEKSLNVGDDEVLADLYAKVGGNREEALEYLKSGQDRELIRSQQQAARESGIRGVPHYTINGEHVILGSKDPEEFAAIFEAILTGQPLPAEKTA